MLSTFAAQFQSYSVSCSRESGRAIARTFFEEGAVLVNPFFILFWHFVVGVDAVDGALGRASTTVNAGIGIDHVGWPAFVLRARDDTFDGADLSASPISDTGLSDYVCHFALSFP
jgi:hypothetical protein